MASAKNDKYYEALCSILDLRLENVVEKHRLINFKELLDHLKDLQDQYNHSEHPKELYKIYDARYAKAHEAKIAREKKREEWCSRYLKVGDWVRVTGTSTSKYRKITAIHEDGFENLQGDPLKNKTRNIATKTSYSKVTEVLNPATRIMEKIKI